jgi:hypothetical protein
MHCIAATNVIADTEKVMANTPKLGKVHDNSPKWWHRAEVTSLSPERFNSVAQPDEDPDETRFRRLAEIALHKRSGRKRDKKAA